MNLPIKQYYITTINLGNHECFVLPSQLIRKIMVRIYRTCSLKNSLVVFWGLKDTHMCALVSLLIYCIIFVGEVWVMICKSLGYGFYTQNFNLTLQVKITIFIQKCVRSNLCCERKLGVITFGAETRGVSFGVKMFQVKHLYPNAMCSFGKNSIK